MELIIDSREGRIIEMLTGGGVVFRSESLVCGDILWEEGGRRLLVERKTAADLAASVTDGRYREQRSRLMEWRGDEHKIMYLIEGPIDEILERTLHRLMISYEIPVWRTENVEQTCLWIQRICAAGTLEVYFKKRDGEQARVESIRFSKNMRKKSICNARTMLITFLNSIHGVSYEMASTIAADTASISALVEEYKQDPIQFRERYSTMTYKASGKKIGKIVDRIIESIV